MQQGVCRVIQAARDSDILNLTPPPSPAPGRPRGDSELESEMSDSIHQLESCRAQSSLSRQAPLAPPPARGRCHHPAPDSNDDAACHLASSAAYGPGLRRPWAKSALLPVSMNPRSPPSRSGCHRPYSSPVQHFSHRDRNHWQVISLACRRHGNTVVLAVPSPKFCITPGRLRIRPAESACAKQNQEPGDVQVLRNVTNLEPESSSCNVYIFLILVCQSL